MVMMMACRRLIFALAITLAVTTVAVVPFANADETATESICGTWELASVIDRVGARMLNTSPPRAIGGVRLTADMLVLNSRAAFRLFVPEAGEASRRTFTGHPELYSYKNSKTRSYEGTFVVDDGAQKIKESITTSDWEALQDATIDRPFHFNSDGTLTTYNDSNNSVWIYTWKRVVDEI
ncbi:hypothetical protein NFJ02_02g69990 [Pycnococcus provasolii]